MNDSLFKIPAKSIETIIGQLLYLREEAIDNSFQEIPFVTMLLSNGKSICGQLLDKSTNADGVNLLLAGKSNVDKPIDELHYIQLNSVCGLTIHHIGKHLHQLSFGKIKYPSDVSLSRLDIKKSCHKYTQIITDLIGKKIEFSVLWDDFVETKAAFWFLLTLIKNVYLALHKISSNQLGKNSIHEKIDKVEFISTKKAEIKIDKNVIEVSFNFEKEMFSKSTLISKIESIL